MTEKQINREDFRTAGSIWNDCADRPAFQGLKTDLKTNVFVIGGGMAGLLYAYMLDRAGVDYMLVEADTVGSGITENTTAKITPQHGPIYHELVKEFDMEKAAMYLHANEDALGRYKNLCRGIDCDLEERDVFVYSLKDTREMEDELDTLGKLHSPSESVKHPPLPFPMAGAARFAGQAQFNPIKFIRGIAGGLDIYEHTRVRELAEEKATTNAGTVTTDHMIVATHFPFINKRGSYLLRIYQHRSYVITLEYGPDLKGMYVDATPAGLSLRNYKDLLLVGGDEHRAGKTGGNWEELRRSASDHYPDVRECCRRVVQDCMTLDHVPYISRYSGHTRGLLAAAGLNKWGVTSSMASAMVLTDVVMGKKNPYEAVFSPSRTTLRPQLAVNGLEATKNLLTLSTPRCPHVGYALKWNQAEHSWDCPCHGSRFDGKGHLTDNPATGDLKSGKGHVQEDVQEPKHAGILKSPLLKRICWEQLL